MNANSQPATLAIKDWLNNATRCLSEAGIPSPSLDAELILAHSLQVNRTFLHAHFDELLDNQNAIQTADKYLESRLQRVPIAYIIGYKEFYGRKFIVTPATLIPRPESEDIISILTDILNSSPISHFPTPNPKLIDVGTGSGCIGITAKLEFPKLNVTLSDISDSALEVAKQNYAKHNADVCIQKSNLLQNFNKSLDIIVANLPYVNRDWDDTSPEIKYEPESALFADDNGTKLIKKLIVEASKKLNDKGCLIIESDPTQHGELIKFARSHSLHKTHELNYVVVFSK